MAINKKASQALNYGFLAIIMGIAAIILFVVLSGGASGKLSSLFGPLFSTVTEPARPDLEAVVTCTQISSGAEDVIGDYGEKLTVQKSKLVLIAKNVGETRASGNIPAEYEISNYNLQELDGLAPKGQYHTFTGHGSLEGDCLREGLAEGEVCPLNIEYNQRIINNAAPRGKFTLKVDEDKDNPVPGRIVEAEGREINRDFDTCAGTMLTNCFDIAFADFRGTFYCPEQCMEAGRAVIVNKNCGGCKNPPVISQVDVDSFDPACSSECCSCPSESYVSKYEPDLPAYGQVERGESCGRLLPDLVPVIKKIEN